MAAFRSAMPVAAALAAAVLGAGPAGASGSDTRISVGAGEVSARGAAVTLPVTIACPDGWRYSLELQVVEAVGDRFASGYGHDSGVCEGGKQELGVYVQANTTQDGRAFRPGPASVKGSLYASEQPDQQVICPMGACQLGYGIVRPPEDMSSNARVTGTVQLRDS